MQYLGIEIGGTKLQLGIGPGDGTLQALWRGSVDGAAGAAGIRQQIASAIPELLTQAGLSFRALHGIGIGFGGPVDDTTHTVIKSHQIHGWDNFPLPDWMSEMVGGLPAVLGNDADVAGLAEALFGAGKGLSPIFYITLGSGIGGGLIINGEIYRGCGRGAAEMGHLRMPSFSFDAPDFKPLEQFASGWGMARMAQEKMRHAATAYPPGLLVTGQTISGQLVAQAAASGDALALSVLRAASEYLAEAICSVIALLCPRRIIIGGGVSLMGEKLLFEPLRRLVAERVFEPFRDCYDIVPAALGEEVVVHGALALARQRLAKVCS